MKQQNPKPSTFDKLGRNPLEKLKIDKPAQVLSEKTISPGMNPLLQRISPKALTFVDKVKEMDIQVNWFELYDEVLGKRIRQFKVGRR